MKKNEKNQLTEKEKRVLYGLVRFPHLNSVELSKKINVKPSTIICIKKRLTREGYIRKINLPILNHLGCELLAVIYTQFNPVIPLKERIKTTKKTIEVFEEIIYSIGEQSKGFSISFSKNYTNIVKINEVRTETFGKLGLLDNKYPDEVIFPFKTSKILRFFDFSNLLKDFYSLKEFNYKKTNDSDYFNTTHKTQLSNTEKKAFIALIKKPQSTYQNISKTTGLSRHTISRMKNKFIKNKTMKQMILPDLKKLGFEILTFYHIKFNPHKPPSEKDLYPLDSPSTIFFASKKFETVIISAYPSYQKYKEDEMKKIRFLKENNLIISPPLIEKYRFENMITIKDFILKPITEKIIKD